MDPLAPGRRSRPGSGRSANSSPAVSHGVWRTTPCRLSFRKPAPPSRIDLSALPLPKLAPPRLPAFLRSRDDLGDMRQGVVAFRFEDDAPAAGIEMTLLQQAADPATEGMRMFEFTGGGAGAADFPDRDGVASTPISRRAASFLRRRRPRPTDPRLDQLYRNRGDGTFVNVTAGKRDRRAPASAKEWPWGDVNHDGFPTSMSGTTPVRTPCS